MPKAVDRSKHFEHLSNEDLVKYAQGTPISIVSGKTIKKGSYEHRYQLASIRKLLLARRLKNQLNGSEVSFNDSFSERPRESDIPLDRNKMDKPEVRKEYTRRPSELKDKQIRNDTPIIGNGVYPVVPVSSTSAFTETSFGFSTDIPSHLLTSTIPIKNKNNYF